MNHRTFAFIIMGVAMGGSLVVYCVTVAAVRMGL